MKTKEQLMDELCAVIRAEFTREATQLKRKLKKALEQRDDYKEIALRYQKQLVEIRKHEYRQRIYPDRAIRHTALQLLRLGQASGSDGSQPERQARLPTDL